MVQSAGRWAVCRPGRAPVEITSRELFRIEVNGELKVTRMVFRHFIGPMKDRELWGQTGKSYLVDGKEQRPGYAGYLSLGNMSR